MFQIEDTTIAVTRGDVCSFTVTADDNGKAYIFKAGEVVRIKVLKKKDYSVVIFQKDFAVEEDTERVEIYLTEKDTKIGDMINKPVDYWYEIELNPYTDPQTIVGHDVDGAKVFRVYPEGLDQETEIEEEEILVVDKELSLTSKRPIENQAVARAILEVEKKIDSTKELNGNSLEQITEKVDEVAIRMSKRIGRVEMKNTADHANLETALEVERQRITQLAKMEEGSTTGDAELEDARVGANGIKYKSTGEAVRRQFNNVLESYFLRTPIFKPQCNINDAGVEVNEGDPNWSANWSLSDWIPVFKNIKFTISGLSGRVCLFDEDKTFLSCSACDSSPYVDENQSFIPTQNGYVRYSVRSGGSEWDADLSSIGIIYHHSMINTILLNELGVQKTTLGEKIEKKHFGARLLCKFKEMPYEEGSIGAEGALGNNPGYFRSTEFIHVNERECYWIHSMYQNTGHFYDENFNYIGDLFRIEAAKVNDSWITNRSIFFPPKGAKYLKISCRSEELELQCIGFGDVPLTDEEIRNASSYVKIPYLKAGLLEEEQERINAAFLNLGNMLNETERRLSETNTHMQDIENWIPGNQWKGKTCAVIGDSISWQDGQPYNNSAYPENKGQIARGWQTILKELLGFAAIDNYAVPGQALTKGNANEAKNGSGLAVIESIDWVTKKYDLVIIAHGANDFKLSVEIGDMMDNEYCFKGALAKAIKYISESAPNTRIVLFTPFHRDQTNWSSFSTLNDAGFFCVDYADVVKSIGNAAGTPVCDIFGGSGVNVWNIHKYTMDGVHPHDLGYEKMSRYIVGFMRNISC